MIRSITVFITLFMATPALPQTLIATIEVSPSSPLPTPLHINLDAITSLPEHTLYIVEKGTAPDRCCAFQIIKKEQRELHWIISPGKTRTYQLLQGKRPETISSGLTFTKNQGALRIQHKGKDLLQYNFATVYPPPGVDSVFKRSAFIHPLWSPGGQVLTRIQPPDHHHHYGIWNPWTHILYKKDTLDLWNLNKKQGTVRFNKFIQEEAGTVFAEYSAIHDHVAFRENREEIILSENQTVRIYDPQGDHYLMDISIQYTCTTQDPVLLLEYRYGGLGWRTTEQWTNANSTVLTSEGKTRKDADGSKARWCLVQGAVDSSHAGIVMMSSPSNYNHPEPLRIWPENQYNRGDMFANFDPTKDRDWLLEPGKIYSLNYRFLVFNNPFTSEKSEAAWQSFTQPPAVKIKIHTKK